MTSEEQDNILLHAVLARYGQINRLSVYSDPNKFLSNLEQFSGNWCKYNPYKPHILRDGLSITSLDGGLTGHPDLTSLPEYNKLHNTVIRETDFDKPTPVYQYALPYFDFIKDHIFRTHVLRLPPGGFFPIHRDAETELASRTIRLLVPIKNCTPPGLFFMYGPEYSIINFVNGFVYYVNTLSQHVVFNASPSVDSYMIVINVHINPESVTAILKNLAVK